MKGKKKRSNQEMISLIVILQVIKIMDDLSSHVESKSSVPLVGLPFSMTTF